MVIVLIISLMIESLSITIHLKYCLSSQKMKGGKNIPIVVDFDF